MTCVCDPPLCGGADLDPGEAGYCKACADLDPEDHCLVCPFECCEDIQRDVDALLIDGQVPSEGGGS